MRVRVESIIALLLWPLLAHALHFYSRNQRSHCFYEELPKGSLVIAQYHAMVKRPQSDTYEFDSSLNLEFTVEETFDNNHRVVSQRSSPHGKFTFSALDSGEHRVCITPSHSDHNVDIRITYDVVQVGSEVMDSHKRDTISLLTNQVKELNNRIQDIKKEQHLIMDREEQFRDESELVNWAVIKWSLIQLCVLGSTCLWQLGHLKRFFVKRKIV